MGKILTTFVKPGRNQPDRLNPSKVWLNRGMVALFDTRHAVEVVSGAVATNVTSTLALSIEGLAADFSGTANQQYAHRPAYALLGEVTILAYLDVDTLTNYGAIIAKQGTNLTDIPYELRLGNTATDSLINVIRANPTTLSQRTASLSSTIAAGSKAVRLAIGLSGELHFTVTSCINGVLNRNIGGGGSTVTDTGTSAVWIGRRYDGAAQLDGRIYYVALFNRLLSHMEMLEWDANPWSVFEQHYNLVPVATRLPKRNI